MTSSTALSFSEARTGLAAAINTAIDRGLPVYIERHGRRVAAIIGAQELERIMELAEDMEDIRAAEEARAQQLATGDEPIPWEEVKADLGLT